MKVNIPEPCHEDWNKMNSQEKGCFCGSCQKLVVDFTAMSDSEIVNYFKVYKNENTCGHFKKTQIDRSLKPQETPRRKLFLKELAAACFAFFLASTDAKAQGGSYFSDEETEETNNNQDTTTQIAINGKVKNGNESLSNAIISIKGTQHKTVSLSNGLFSIHIPNEIAQNQNFITLVVEYEGFATKEIEVATSPTNQFVEIDFAERELVITVPSLTNEEIHIRGFSVSIPDSITVKGTVKDETGEVLPATSIQIKRTNQGVITDMEGNYSITVPKDAILVFRYVGFSTHEIDISKVQNDDSVDIVLTEGFIGEITIIRKWYSPRGAWYKIRAVFR